jgi:hypothetical protein
MHKNISNHFARNLLVVGLLNSCTPGRKGRRRSNKPMLNRSPQPVKQDLSLAFAAYQE